LTGCATTPQPGASRSRFVAERGSARLVVFVHGVGGDADRSWRNAITNTYWPELLASDPAMKGFDVYVAAYASPLLGRASTIEEVAQRLLQQLRDRGFFTRYQQIHFITHSMGGLVVKRLLVELNRPSELETLRRIRTVLFISTPAQGATLADTASWLSLNPQLRDMAPADLNSFLQSLDNQWDVLLHDRDAFAGVFPRAYCAYETLPTGGVMVVSRVYAASRCDPPRYPIDLDHNAIAKPQSRDDDPYPWSKARILETAAISSTRATLPSSTTHGGQERVERLQSDVAKLVRFPGAIPDSSKPPSLLERMLRNRLPLRLFDLLASYDERDIRAVPTLHKYFTDYYEFREQATVLEDQTMQHISKTVKVRFPAGWAIYLQYTIMRFGGRSKQDIISGGDFLNYDITWDDAERLFEELSRLHNVNDNFAKFFAWHQRLINAVNAIAASL
jgi:pimeloyl-ACP methyl ester carboxylesterase